MMSGGRVFCSPGILSDAMVLIMALCFFLKSASDFEFEIEKKRCGYGIETKSFSCLLRT
jgi:hypothetical protein